MSAQGWARRAFIGLTGMLTLLGAVSCVPLAPSPRVVAYGDSLMFETQPALRAGLTSRGISDVTVHAYGGTAISDWWTSMESESLRSDSHTLFIVEFGSNYFTAGVSATVGHATTDADVQRHGYTVLVQQYAEDAARAEGILTRRGARVLWVGGPAMPTRPWAVQVNDRFALLARSHPRTSAYIEAGLAVAPNRVFTPSLPCNHSEPGCRNGRVVVRSADRIHLCPAFGTALRGVLGSCPVYSGGEVRFAAAISDAATRLAGR